MSTTTPLRRRLPALLLATALAGGSLAGCSASVETEEDPGPAEEQESAEEETTETEDPADDTAEETEAPAGTEDEATEDPADAAEDTEDSEDEDADADAGEAGGAGSGEVAAPGTTVSVGDTLVTHVQALDEGDDYYGFATVATTVVSVEQGDPEFWQIAANAEEFDGYIPWFVKSEFEWLTYEGQPNSNMLPNLYAYDGAGEMILAVGTSDWTQGIPDCEIEIGEKGQGGTATNCQVYALPEGQEITAVGWEGDDYADGNYSQGNENRENPYQADPVLWTVD